MSGVRNPPSKLLEAAVYIAGWYLFSLSISIYNKWMFGKGLDFKFPILITSFHQFCLIFLSTGVLYLQPHLHPTVNEPTSLAMSWRRFWAVFRIDFWTYGRQILPCSLASSGDIGLSNVSFRFISLSLYTMLKTSSLVFVLLFGLLFRLEKFNWRLVIIVLVMTVSVVMMVKKPDNVDSADDHNVVGIFMVLTASMVSGLRWSFTQLLLKRNPYTVNPISTIFYISPSMCITLFLFGLIFEGWSNFISSPIWELKGIFGTILLMIIPGILAFMMTLCEFKLLSVSQVTTLSIAGIFKELLTIVLSSIIFGDKLSFINCVGLVITFMDILWYNYYRYHENRLLNEYASVNQDEETEDDIEMDDRSK
ncbi:TPT-domain-containing protein [Suhomyces tanzawaensis NRRL Y-17324]|uniref:TPT-domain-containing protein n=1 Tax=Suhomyces tanzawaensis NRRL Y-17324 TaxID=984487 RepID=A0A1E4SJP7_9ASCO|nr:TPT-domain-containing protein [Suhomyces tanzawaensis NRRL Y-17324]ODV79718.1 TPT-domain-containing protein [Suhomyces tanzawaensis NRRL Y-17324]